MKLLTKPIREKLIKNFKMNEAYREKHEGETLDLEPVVKFFGGSSATWLITEYDEENDLYFGLCDPGLGFPEVGYVSKSELEAVRFPPFRLPVERDRYFKAEKTLSQYAKEAKANGYISA